MIQHLILAQRQGPLIIACTIVLGLVAGAYAQGRASGKADREAHYSKILAERDQAEVAALTQAILREREATQAAAALEREHLEAELERVREQKVVTKVVKEYIRARPSLDHCNVDVDGLRLWNAANAGRAKSPGPKRP